MSAPDNALLAACRERRARVLQHLRAGGGGVAILPTAPEAMRNRDSDYPYRHDSYFYYISGFPEPDAVVALVAGDEGDRHLLFCREKDQEREIWDGFRYGPDAAREIFGFDEAHPIDELDRFLPELADSIAEQISIESAQPKLDLGVLRDLAGKRIMLGVIDLSDPAVETPALVAERIRRGLQYVKAENLIPAPDCGMKYLPREAAFGKLKALADGAAMVRREVA